MTKETTTPAAAAPTLAADTILDAAKRVLPEAKIVDLLDATNPRNHGWATQLLVAVPSTHQLQTIDLAKHLPAPERIKGTATATDLPSLLAYLQRHADPFATTVWVLHDPESSTLNITGRINDHGLNQPGWADHTVVYNPRPSVEWKRWLSANGQKMDQLAFANFLEDNLTDIHPGEVSGMPSAGDMLQMAVAFESVQDMRVKSHARTQDGGIKLEFADAADDTTAKKMEAFSRFRIALPVFYGGARFPLTAKLRFNARKAIPEFWFELIRPDQTHLAASLHLIQELRAGLTRDGDTEPRLPVLMGKA